MGMTIDAHIEVLKSYHNGFTGYAGNLQDSIDFAIETMRKYQKIEQIVSDFREYQKGISCGFGGATYMQMVSEVVEDGNDD